VLLRALYTGCIKYGRGRGGGIASDRRSHTITSVDLSLTAIQRRNPANTEEGGEGRENGDR